MRLAAPRARAHRPATRLVVVVALTVGVLASLAGPAAAAAEASLRVGAVDTELRDLAGAGFTLHDDTGATVAACTTVDPGGCTLGPVPHGVYELRRPTAPTGYVAEVAAVPVRLDDGCGGLCLHPPVVHNRRAYAIGVTAERAGDADTFEVRLTDGSGAVDGALVAVAWDGAGTLVGAADGRTTTCTTVGGVCVAEVAGADATGRLTATFATAHQHATTPTPLPAAVPDGDVAVSAIAASALPARALGIAVELQPRQGGVPGDGDLLVGDGTPVLGFSPGQTTPLEAVFDVLVTNNGEAPLTGVSVVDDRLGTLLEGASLAVGEQLVVELRESFTFDDLLAAGEATVVRIVQATGTGPDDEVAAAAAEGPLELVAVGGVQEQREDPAPEPEPEPAPVVTVDEPAAAALPEAGLGDTDSLWVLSFLLLAAGATILRRTRPQPA